MSAVPRKHEASVRGIERARIGASAAAAREGSARADALQLAQSDALRAVSEPAGLADWCTLAAANVDYSARVLLELCGQDARGPCRTRAWILRNGARIRKGERGYAVSMFGAYVWRLEQTTESFGGFGHSAYGDAPADELEGWRSVCGGDPIAAAIIAAMRGYRVGSVAGPAPDLERLDVALRRARGVAWNLPACLSCDGAGCVLCSCADDRTRQGAIDCNPMPLESVPVPSEPVGSVAAPDRSVARRVGRPRAVRPELPDVAAAMREVRRLRAERDRLHAEAAAIEYEALKLAWATHSLADIAEAAGITRARVHQIVKSD